MATSNQDVHGALVTSTRIHIADINPDAFTSDVRHIAADVVLVWPYSSATKELSLLLAEPDVSLQKARGQVRVTFHDACAREVAKAKVGIGETLRLNLKDARMVEEDEIVSTPGKKAGFTLHFNRRIRLQVRSSDGQLRTVEYIASPLPPAVAHDSSTEFQSPHLERSIHVSNPALNATSTPSLKTGSRLSWNSYSTSFVDPFAAEDGDGPGRGRKRPKFGRHSGSWRLVDAGDDDAEVHILDEKPPARNGHAIHAQDSDPNAFVEITDDDTFITKRRKPSRGISVHRDRNDGVPQNDSGQPTLFSPSSEVYGIHDAQHIEQTNVSHASTSAVAVEPSEVVELPFPERTHVLTPRLQASLSPHLSVVSPLATRSSYVPLQENQLLALDLSGQEPIEEQERVLVDELADHPVPSVDSSLLMQEIEGDLGQSDLRVTQQKTTVIPSETFSSEPQMAIDFDALQRQIELDHAADPAYNIDRTFEHADLYGPPMERHIEELREPTMSQIASDPGELSQGSAHDQPIVLDDGDDESIESMENSSRTTSVVSENSPEVLPQHIIEENDLTNFVNSQSISAEPQLTAKQYPQPDQLDLPPLTSNTNSQVIQSGPYANSNRHLFLDGVISGSELSPLDPVKTVTVESSIPTSPDIEDGARHAPVRVHEVMQVASDQMPVLEANTRKEALGRTMHKTVPAVLTPQATQSDALMIDDISSRLPHDLPPTPLQSQKETDVQQSSPIDGLADDEILPPPPTTADSTTPRRASRRFSSKPQMSDGLYSNYFTPRKSKISSTGPISSEVAGSQSTMIQERSSSPAMHHPEATHKNIPLQGHSETTQSSNRLETMQTITSSGAITDLGFFTHLASIGEYYNQTIDILGISTAASTMPERAKTGPKDFYTTLHLADASTPAHENSTTPAQIFRPRKNAIPHVERGDAVLLRNFKVQSQSHKLLLLSTDESAWVVFRSESDLQDRIATTISGPPVEYGSMEESTARALMQWWFDNGHLQHTAILTNASDSSQPATKVDAVQTIEKPIPPPLDLRKSTRRTRQDRRSIDTTSQAAQQAQQSPDADMLSPTFTPTTTRNSMPPPPSATSVASPISPTSPRALRSSRSRSAAAPAATAEDFAKVPATALSKPRRPRKNSRGQPPPQPMSPQFLSQQSSPIISESAAALSSPRRPSDATSIATLASVTEETTSLAAKRRRSRRERGSATVVHELRDGTTWVDNPEEANVLTHQLRDGTHYADIPDEERIVEEDVRSEADNHTVVAAGEAQAVTSTQIDSTMTPQRRGRGRATRASRRKQVAKDVEDIDAESQHEKAVDEALNKTQTKSLEEAGVSNSNGRVTRSRTVKDQE